MITDTNKYKVTLFGQPSVFCGYFLMTPWLSALYRFDCISNYSRCLWYLSFILFFISTCTKSSNPLYCISPVMAGMLASSVVDLGFKPWTGQTKDYQLVFFAFRLSKQHYGVRTKTGWWHVYPFQWAAIIKSN